tara:strand:- start:95 stop:427 length:333 start_codon:yes stop_codon:yes gene_type:complete
MFPLFETCYKMTENSNTVLEYNERLILSNKIKELDKQAHEYIYAIIRTYQLEHDKDNFYNMPYSMRKNKNGVKFEMSKIPSRLVLIIHFFVDLHLKSLKETNRSSFFEKK